MSASRGIHAVTMPKWGIEMTEGTLGQWTARVGQRVERGEPLLDVETDKIVNTVESPAAGVLRRIVADTGEIRPVGALIAVLATEEVSEAEVVTFIDQFRGATVNFEPDAGEPGIAAAPAQSPDVRVSPIARRLAETLGIDVATIQGTGRNGRVSKEDVEAHAARLAARTAEPASIGPAPSSGLVTSSAPAASSGPPASDALATRIPMSASRVTIARRLLESSQTIPHYRLQIDVDVARLRARGRQLAGQSGVRITLNDLLVRACALALVRHPQVNAQFDGQEILQFPHADIAIAVATSGGLLTPVVRAADQKPLAQIARLTADLSDRARRGALTRAEITGGTFTISNLGKFGIASFDAIINPPQVAILAVGAVEERLVARAGAAAVAPMLTLTLSADHRVVDGASGAAFLATVREVIEASELS
ncbi:MAG TPA: dihydrolipoamide acetyltransferase family protein [Steroidobacteraceae bacterium]|nr:dihydrolipoamide acetyltransferase family protein [Steroidobacteraceae bacterium]